MNFVEQYLPGTEMPGVFQNIIWSRWYSDDANITPNSNLVVAVSNDVVVNDVIYNAYDSMRYELAVQNDGSECLVGYLDHAVALYLKTKHPYDYNSIPTAGLVIDQLHSLSPNDVPMLVHISVGCTNPMGGGKRIEMCIANGASAIVSMLTRVKPSLLMDLLYTP